MANATSDGDHVWRHPLADGDLAAATELAEDGLGADEILSELGVGMRFEEGEDGSQSSWSGAFRVDRSVERTREWPDEVEVEPEARVHPDVQLLLDAAAELGDEPFALTAALREPVALRSVPTFGRGRLQAILEGTVRSYADERLLREDLVLRRIEAWLPTVGRAADCFAGAGAFVSSEAPASGVLDLVVPAWALADVVSCPDLGSLDLTEGEATDDSYSWTTHDSATGALVNGDELEDLLQTRVFYNHTAETYDGAGEDAGLTETFGHQVLESHPGFEDQAGVGRYENCVWNMVTQTCGASTPDPGKQHATATASTMIGDVTANQDPGVTGDEARREQSGVARGATLVGIGDTRTAVEDFFTSSAFDGHLVNQSSSPGTETDCSGTDAWSRTVNTVFESGVAWMKSASNDSHTSSTDCNVGSPGAAIGAFTVGAYHLVGTSTTSDVNENQSRGGTASEGRGRTILAVTAPNHIEFPYQADSSAACTYQPSWPDQDPCQGDFKDTSAATPLVSGSALVFREWFLDAEGAAINDPALLYTFLLLMGDRWTDDSYSNGWNNLTGAGRLRLRAFDALGMDSPWGWGYGEVCVMDGVTTSFTLTGTLPSAVDILRVVSWWYDARHDDTTPHDHDKVEMRLQVGGSISQSSTTDNRQRIHKSTGLAGNIATLKFEGTDVSSDYAGCGVNGIPVSYAWFYESSARNDTTTDSAGDNPMDYIRAEP